jgi:transforming growth factor-beta-induced protein
MFDKLNLVDTLLKNAKFSIFAKAVTASELVNTLKSKGPFTILAPTDEAFKNFPQETLAWMMKPENKENLASWLEYHIIPGKIMSGDINKLTKAKTVQGQEIQIDSTPDIKINGAKLQDRNIDAMNGVIHAIDTVLVLAKTAKTV